MTSTEFLKRVIALARGHHLEKGRSGSEENVKIKFILPLLQCLGYDVMDDMDFEVHGADIRIGVGSWAMIVECKSWDAVLSDHLNQCIEYSLKFRHPYVLLSSGQETRLYSTLVDPRKLDKEEPLLKFRFADLKGPEGAIVLSQLTRLVSKNSIELGESELRREVSLRLKGKSFAEAQGDFDSACRDFTSKIKLSRLTVDEFDRRAAKLPKARQKAVAHIRREFAKIADGSKHLRLRFRSREIGLECLDDSGPRAKVRGLVGVYPGDAHVAFGRDNWKRLGLSAEELIKLRSFSGPVEGMERARKLVMAVRAALNDIGRT